MSSIYAKHLFVWFVFPLPGYPGNVVGCVLAQTQHESGVLFQHRLSMSQVQGESRQNVVARVVAQMAWKICTDLRMSSQECEARIARVLLPGL